MWYVVDVDHQIVVSVHKTRREAYDSNRNHKWTNPLIKYRVEHAS